jgi:hypothetical protein
MFDFPQERKGRSGLKHISKKDPPGIFFDVTDWSIMVLFKRFCKCPFLSGIYCNLPQLLTSSLMGIAGNW